MARRLGGWRIQFGFESVIVSPAAWARSRRSVREFAAVPRSGHHQSVCAKVRHCRNSSGASAMSAFNIVRFHVKTGHDQEFLDAFRQK
jgi:hypothetical protein